MSFSNESKQRLSAIAIVAIIALLAINAILIYHKIQLDKELKEKTEQLTETEQIKTELEKQYYEALSHLEEMKGDNDFLNGIIDSQQLVLKTQKNEISKMISTGKELKKARVKLQELVAQGERYIAEINSLQVENAELVTLNTQLSEEKRILQDEINKEREQTQVLVSEKVELEEERSKLAEEGKTLKKKVDAASVIPVSKISVAGYKTKSSDKLVRKRYAKSVDLLKICFDTKANQLTEDGIETFYIRIINPIGTTLSVDNMGSGVITNQANGKDMKFTKAQELEYVGDGMSSCINWSSETPFDKGTYSVEVYNKGFITGSTNFTLK